MTIDLNAPLTFSQGVALSLALILITSALAALIAGIAIRIHDWRVQRRHSGSRYLPDGTKLPRGCYYIKVHTYRPDLAPTDGIIQSSRTLTTEQIRQLERMLKEAKRPEPPFPLL